MSRPAASTEAPPRSIDSKGLTEDVSKSILQGIDTALLVVLGDAGKSATLYYMGTCGVSHDDIPVGLELFMSTLRDMYRMGADLIEKRIVEDIRLRESLPPDLTELSDVVRELRRRTRQVKTQ